MGRAGRRPTRLRAAAIGLAVLALPSSLAGCIGCPTALLEGVLVRDGSTLAVDADSGEVVPVRWPFGYGVRADGDKLVVTDLFGSVKAREGDRVHLGGGMVPPDEQAFGVCGDFTVDAS